MTVQSLNSLITHNKRLKTDDHRLSDCGLLIDADTVTSWLFNYAAKGPTGFHGLDYTTFRRTAVRFFEALEKCKIEPILVFSGVKNSIEANNMKVSERLDLICETGWPQIYAKRFLSFFVANEILQRLALERNLRVIQGLRDNILDLKPLAGQYQWPILSSNPDLFLEDIPGGVILTRGFLCWRLQCAKNPYVRCTIYRRENFLEYLPDLNLDTLPLLARVSEDLFWSLRYDPDSSTRTNSFRGFYVKGINHRPIVSLLHLLRGKSYEQAEMDIAIEEAKLEEGEPSSNSTEDSDEEVTRDEQVTLASQEVAAINQDAFATIRDLVSCEVDLWLRETTNRSLLIPWLYELKKHQKIHLHPLYDDRSQPSAHKCSYRILRVMIQLLRSSRDERQNCKLFNRVGQKYTESTIGALHELAHLGELDYIIDDLPELDERTRKSILLSSIRSSLEDYERRLARYEGSDHLRELQVLEMILEFNGLECDDLNSTERRQFNFGVVAWFTSQHVAKVLHRTKPRKDYRLKGTVITGICRQSYATHPTGRSLKIVHMIQQMVSSVTAFNMLNALLDNLFTTVKLENWLNSPALLEFVLDSSYV